MPDQPLHFVPSDNVWYVIYDKNTGKFYNGQDVFIPQHAWEDDIENAMLYTFTYFEDHHMDDILTQGRFMLIQVRIQPIPYSMELPGKATDG